MAIFCNPKNKAAHLKPFIFTFLLLFALAPAATSAEPLDFTGPLFGSKIDPKILSGRWAKTPDECTQEIGESAEIGRCIYALMYTDYYDPTHHVVAELCYEESPDWFNPGSFKVIKIIDEDTISVQPATQRHWQQTADIADKRSQGTHQL